MICYLLFKERPSIKSEDQTWRRLLHSIQIQSRGSYPDDSNPSRRFRILSEPSRIQKKRRSVTFYQSWVQVYTIKINMTPPKQNKFDWKPFWISSQFSSSCNSAYKQANASEDPRREHSRFKDYHLSVIFIFSIVIISVEATIKSTLATSVLFLDPNHLPSWHTWHLLSPNTLGTVKYGMVQGQKWCSKNYSPI